MNEEQLIQSGYFGEPPMDRLHHEITEILVYSIYRYAYSKYAETANEINELNEEAKYRYRNDNFFHHAINTITAQIIDAINRNYRCSQQ